MVKSEAKQFLGDIISNLERRKLSIRNIKMLKLQALNAVKFLSQHNSSGDCAAADIDSLASGLITVIEIAGENAFEQVKKLCGPDDENDQHSTSLRELFGIDNIHNCFITSNDITSNNRDLEFFFPYNNNNDGDLKVQPKLNTTCTLCLIKPHAIKNGNIGQIIKMIMENGFHITAIKTLRLNRNQVEAFYEIYQGVVADYQAMVSHLMSGPIIALEIEGNDTDVQLKFRNLCGPADVEVAKVLRPHTIRAHFGVDKIQNAVHCTDLSEDTLLELEYIFKELQ
jgi:nucleoside-diphosphate kinase